jgi:hypothetical protein
MPRNDINLTPKDLEKWKELRTLYNISEAEEYLVFQLLLLVKMLGLSRKLSIKILNFASVAMEAIGTED